ncbi:MAG: DUF748 domain-containing protein [Candidatus Omnitrophica bacterium]|nr:DUF748 domain-containing protein [Candidatus Omnitrophota bacterium]
MKILKKSVIIVIVVLIILYSGVNIFIAVKGKALISDSLTEIFGKNVSVGSAYLVPPYSISINDFEIEDFLVVDKIKAEPSIIGLFFGKIGLNKLIAIKPQATITRISDQKFNINPIIDNIVRMQAEAALQKKQNMDFFVKDFILRDGRVSFEDKTTGVSLGVYPAKIYVHTNILTFKTVIRASADIISSRDAHLGKVSMNGWLNLPNKNMDAEFNLEDLDATYFYPYFSKFISPIESGEILFSADMLSKNNDLVINCHLEMQDFKFSTQALALDIKDKQITLPGNLSGLILDSVVGPGGSGVFDFTIRTKFDSPRLEGLQFKGNIFKQTIENVIKNTPQKSIEILKGTGKDFESIGKQFKQQFKDIKDVFKVFKDQAGEEELVAETNPDQSSASSQ